MSSQKTSLFVMMLYIATSMNAQDSDVNLITDVLVYENIHSSTAFTTVLRFCRGSKESLLRALSDAGISTLVTDGERTYQTMERISRSDPGDLMLAGQQPDQRGFPVSFFIDMDCKAADQILQKAAQLNFFKSPYRWLILQDASLQEVQKNMDNHSFPCDVSRFENLPIRADSHVTVSCRYRFTEGGDRWAFQHYYRSGPNASITAQRRGSYHQGKLNIERHSNLLNRRDLMGYPVGAAFVVTDNSSLSHLTDGVDRHIDVLAKAPFLNVMTVLELLNSTPYARFPNTWGYKRINGIWQDGMLGMLHQGEVEIGGTGLMLIATRYDAVQFLIFTTPIYGIFMFRAPPISYEYNLFGLPFSKSVWFSSAVVLSLCCGLLVPVMRYERYNRKYEEEIRDKKGSEEKTQEDNSATLADVVLLGFAAICQQGTATHMRGASSRMITLWLHLCVICLYASYTASIVVLLQTSGTSIRNLRDLWESNIEVAAEDTPYNLFFFTNSTEEVRRGIYRDKMLGKSPTNNFLTLEEGVDLVRTRFFAFHSITNNFYQIIGSTWQEEEKCGLIEFDNYLPSTQVALSVRRTSPYMEMFRVKFSLLHESGHRDWLLKRWVYPKPKCPPNMVRFSSVSVIDVNAAIKIFAIGVLLSGFILILEQFTAKFAILHKGNRRLRLANAGCST